MKKIIVLFSMLLIGLSLMAQRGGGNNDGPRFSWEGAGTGNGIQTIFGASIGVSAGSFSNSTGSPRTGVALSAFLSVPVTQTLRIRPEFSYAQAGARDGGYRFDADYFQLPLLASIQLSSKGGLYLLAGPQLSLLMSASQMTSLVKTDVRDNMRVSDLSIVGGLEWVPKHVGVYVRGQYGLGNASQSAGPAMHAAVLSAGLAVHF